MKRRFWRWRGIAKKVIDSSGSDSLAEVEVRNLLTRLFVPIAHVGADGAYTIIMKGE